MSLTFEKVKPLRPGLNIGAILDSVPTHVGRVYGHPLNPRCGLPTDVEELRRIAMAVGIDVDAEHAAVERFCERLKSRMVVTAQVPVLPDQPEANERPLVVLDSLSLYLEQK